MPPKVWDEYELGLAGAINVGPMEPPNLTNNIHNILKRECWQVEDHEYETLLPSLRLASRWIEVAIPYIATFLPSDSIHEQLGSDTQVDEPEITVKKSVKPSDLRAASDELDQIAQTTKWQVNYEMLAQRGWLGITRLTPGLRPWESLTPGQIYKSDREARQRGYNRRPLIIGVMGQYIEVLDESEPTSERYLRAAFMAAYTITHEVGHLMFHQDFRSTSYTDDLSEPFVGDDHWSELGFSFMAWIFSGYNPNICDMGKHMFSFDGPLHWEALLKGRNTERPVYKPLYSLSMKYIQDVFTDSFWTGLGETTKPTYAANARGKLKPNINKLPAPATAMLPQFRFALGELEWKSKNGDRGYRPELEAVLSPAEIELEMARKKTILDPRDLLPKKAPREGDSGSERGNFAGPPTRGPWFGGGGDDDDEEEYGTHLPVQPPGPFGGYSDRNKDDEKEWGNSSDHDKTPDKKLASAIDDGWVEADIHLTTEQSQRLNDGRARVPETTRIEVRYRPDVRVTASAPPPASSARKRRRSSVQEEIVGPLKRTRLGSSDKAIEDDSVDALLEKWSVRNVEARFTHRQAHDYCMKEKIFPGHFEASAMWQQSRLDGFNDRRDRWLVESMRQHVFLKAQEKYNVNEEQSVYSLLRLKMEIRQSVQEWGPQALIEYCTVQGLSDEGDLLTLRGRVQRWFRDDIEMTKQSHIDAVQTAAAGVLLENHSFNWPTDDHWETENPSTWSKEDFDSYFRTHKLPDFGTPKCLRERVHRHREEQQNGIPISRNTNSIYARTNKNGLETYVFYARLPRSTVESLKSSLFITGRFYPETILTLYFGADIAHPLKDDEPLSNHKYKDWTDLTLKVTQKWIHDVDNFKGKEIVIYQPRGQLYTDKGKKPADPALRREAEIRARKVKPTLRERLNGIVSTGEELNQATMPSGGHDILRPHTRQMKSTSAVEILDSLEDIEELKQRANDMILAGMNDEEVEVVYKEAVRRETAWRKARGEGKTIELPEDEDDDDVAPPPGSTHMGDLFRNIKP